MFDDLLPAGIRHFIDSIFSPPSTFLQLIVDKLGDVSLIVGRGINVNNYFGFFNYMPDAWQTVVQSLLASAVLLGMLWVIKSIWDMYVKVKGGVKWW